MILTRFDVGLGITNRTLLKQNAFLVRIGKRFKKTKTSKVTNTKRALDYFDIAYPPVYGGRWPSIRLALLSKQKYFSVINNFSDYESTIENFQELGAVDIRHRYEIGVERLNVRMAKLKEQKSNAEENSNCHTTQKDDEQKVVRPSLLELDDDELAARGEPKEIARYPEKYRLRTEAQELSLNDQEVDFSNRVIKASQVDNEEGLLMDYIPPTRLKGLEDWVEETDVFHEVGQSDEDIGVKKEIQKEPFEFPKMLKIYSFLKGDISNFPHPKSDRNLKVLNHYPLDGASLLPVLALDLKPNDKVLDLCAAPGGKSLIALQTLMPLFLRCNDVSNGRVRRIQNVLIQHIPKGLSSLTDMIDITMENGCQLSESGTYDKVLVDVPCLTDRHSVKEDDNSIFIPRRLKERMKLPEIQGQLLMSALQAVKPGGIVVYSTCTMSPLQNDGAVHLALSRIWQETTIQYSIVDMSYAIQPLNFLYRFGTSLGLRYGQIVLPSLLNNFGPMYICKIRRLS